MQFFYDGQLRRYLTQVIRLLSNFVVRAGDGTLTRVPVLYGDTDRQVAHIIGLNSENSIQSTPRIAVYISDFDLDRTRLGDATFVGKVHIRERAIDENGVYTTQQGKNYTVERLMPTPFNLTLKVDIWSSSTEQKLQILEQILVLFNPSLEIQTTDNYIDWTSLSVVELGDVMFSSRSVPVGTNISIDIATLTLTTPVWLSPPVKVKKLGIVTNIISNLFNSISSAQDDYIDGLGTDWAAGERAPAGEIASASHTTIGNFDIFVSENVIRLISNESGSSTYLAWAMVIEQMPGSLIAGLSKIYLVQDDGTEVVGNISLNPLDDTQLSVNWDSDTFPSNNYIDSDGLIETIDTGYDSATGRGTFDAIVDPTTFNPKRPNNETTDQAITSGIRYLVIDNIGGGSRETFVTNSRVRKIDTGIDFDRVVEYKLYVNNAEVAVDTPINSNGSFVIVATQIIPADSKVTYMINFNEDGPDAWKNADSSDFIANANDIIEWKNNKWNVIFDSAANDDKIIYQTNFYTTVQYKWNGVSWVKSFEGEYKRGKWKIQL